MSKVTICKNTDFTVLDNGIFRDKNLSLKARGLLATMLSLPEEWDYTVEGLSVILKEGQSCIKSVLKELEECGYLERRQKRASNSCFDKMEYIIYEKPINKGFEPSVENPPAENPTAGNRTQLNKKELSKKESNKHFNGLHRPESEYSGQRVLHNIDYEILKRQIKLETTNLGYSNDTGLIACMTEVFTYYFKMYELHLNEEHTILSKNAMQNVIQRYIDGSEIAVDLQYSPNDYKKMINRHFEKDYGMDIDYSICHFMTDGIRDCLYYEVLY